MATTPTVTLSTTSVTVVATIATTVNTDTQQLWRTDESGAFIKLSSGVTLSGSAGSFSGTFTDHNVESGRLYRYFARAVDGSGGTKDSTIKQTSLTLSSGIIHLCSKTDGNRNVYRSNGVDLTLSLLDQAPHKRGYRFASTSFAYAGSTTPDIRQSLVEDEIADIPVIVVWTDASSRQTLQRMVDSNAMACFRGAFGKKSFGQLRDYVEQYDYTLTGIPLVFEVLDYIEGLS